MPRRLQHARLAAVAAVGALGLLTASAAQATIIYATGFEAPTYTLGALGGQDGWGTFGAAGAIMVEGSAPISGGQSVAVTSSVTLSQTGPFHSDPSGISLVTLSADILLTGAGAGDRSWQFSAIGAGLSGFAGGIDIDSGTNNIRAIGNGFPVIGTFSRDVVHRVDIFLDYGAQTYGVGLDGSLLASGLAFCGDNGPCAGAPVPAYNTLLFDTFGTQGGDVGYLDNVIVQSTAAPEPSSWALMIAGFGLAGASLRRMRFRSAAARG